MAWRVVSRPALALPPPTGTAAKPRHCPRAPQRSPAAARGHHRGLARCDFWPISCVLLQTSSIGGVFRVAFCPVVTNVVNPMAFSLKIVVFGRRLTTFVTGVLTRCSKLLRFDDVCNVGRPLVARPGPATAHGHRSLAPSARWPGCLKPPSPLLARARVGLKPSSPFRVRNGRFCCSFRLHWCCWFQWVLFRGAQW